MISIKKFIERRRSAAEDELLGAALQFGRLLLDALATQPVRGREADYTAFCRKMKELSRRLEKPPDALSLLTVASDAAETLENYAGHTADYVREQNELMQNMLAMLTETLADVSGRADASVSRLQKIEKEIERASGLDDVRGLSASLESCLAQLREAAAQEKRSSAAAAQRLRDHIRDAEVRIASPSKPSSANPAEIEIEPDIPDEPPEVVATDYVAVFKLQRADHIVMRFGENAKHQMLSLISQNLKSILGPNGRLLRWKGTSFVMFVRSTATLNEMRVVLTETVAKMGQHYIEVGKKSALLSIGVDWIVFPQSQCPSLDAVFSEVDAFLAAEPAPSSRQGATRLEDAAAPHPGV